MVTTRMIKADNANDESESPWKEENTHRSLKYYVKNIGNKPIILYKAKLVSKDQVFSGIEHGERIDRNPEKDIQFPYKLEEGERIVISSDLFSMLPEPIEISEKTKKEAHFILQDGAGREYKCKVRGPSGNEREINALMKEFFG